MDKCGAYECHKIYGVSSCQACRWTVTYYIPGYDSYNLTDSLDFITKAIGETIMPLIQYKADHVNEPLNLRKI